MEPHEHSYITQIMQQLANSRGCYYEIVATLVALNILSVEELSNLEAITDKLDRNFHLVEILKPKPHAYKLLLATLAEVNNQNPVPVVYQHCEVTSTSIVYQNSSQGGFRKSYYKLNFGEHNIKHIVLPKVRAGLVEKMGNEDTNSVIINQLGALNYFDHNELKPLLTGRQDNQQIRMLSLFALVAILDAHEILNCFEKLCNLDDQPIVSDRLRKVFLDHYPACLMLSEVNLANLA